MKALTIEQKARAYDETLERAKECLKDGTITTIARDYIWEIFPELAESEDERIRKKVIEVLKLNIKGAESQMQASRGVDRCFEIYACNKVIAWLEKQDEKKPNEWHCEDEQCIGCINDKGCVTCVDGNMKETNGKPKFKVGDWVVNSTTLNLCHILKVEHGQYICDDCSFPITKENEYHLWTIQDARNGDVLASKDGYDILIFRNLDSNANFSSYYNIRGNGELGWSNIRFIPATKEQRDLLFAKMKEAGYKWDSKKKELKKI